MFIIHLAKWGVSYVGLLYPYSGVDWVLLFHIAGWAPLMRVSYVGLSYPYSGVDTTDVCILCGS